MKVLVLGAGGIIGQHLMVSVPGGVEATFTRRTASHLYEALDLTEPWDKVSQFLDSHNPDVIVNLAGESRPDVVEKDPAASLVVNSLVVANISGWCDGTRKNLIHVSSQAILDPVNVYGVQKSEVEKNLEKYAQNWIIVRPTFVLGIRPFPGVGRENPAERLLSGCEKQSVSDRFFSVSFAWDVAEYIWKLCTSPVTRRQVHCVGHPERLSRHELAARLGVQTELISHDSLSGLAPRPLDTSGAYAHAQRTGTLDENLLRLKSEYEARTNDTLQYRAKELAAFFKLHHRKVEERLALGFGPLHNAVTEDFRKAIPRTDDELLTWYRATDSYLWELTAYHSDPGFNYRGMVSGIVEALKVKGVKSVLCLGDGTGDLALAVQRFGMTPYYHDLSCSKTARFAESRFFMRLGDYWQENIGVVETGGFDPLIDRTVDAVVSLDFLEHVPNVEAWVGSVSGCLRPGGFFVAQNAFAMGSGDQGSMPMHLSTNDHWERDWDPLLTNYGFKQLAPQWYQKPEAQHA